jgi:hypothetical protein
VDGGAEVVVAVCVMTDVEVFSEHEIKTIDTTIRKITNIHKGLLLI